MSNILNMISAAREGNAVEFEKLFHEDINNRLGDAINQMRTSSYRSALGLSEAEDTDNEDENDDDDEDEDGDDKNEKNKDKEED